MNTTTIEHRDTHQTYWAGKFHTWCTCGMPCPGNDPEDADARWFDHRDAAQRRTHDPEVAPEDVARAWIAAHEPDEEDALTGAAPAEIAAYYLDGDTCRCCGVDFPASTN